jgi:hypothetical protein
MFYVEEDITPAVAVATQVFGKSGRILIGDSVMYNAAVVTREFGKIWHGDLDLRSIEWCMNVLTTRLKTTVYLFDGNNHFNFKKAHVFETSGAKPDE